MKTKLNEQSEQNILNMLMDHSVISDSQLSKINLTSGEIGKSKLETAFELNFTNENKIVNILSSTYSLDIVDLKQKKIDLKIKKILDFRFMEENSVVPFEIMGDKLKVAIPDGSKLSLMKTLKTMTQLEPELYAASISNINDFIQRIKDTNEEKISPTNVKVEK